MTLIYKTSQALIFKLFEWFYYLVDGQYIWLHNFPV